MPWLKRSTTAECSEIKAFWFSHRTHKLLSSPLRYYTVLKLDIFHWAKYSGQGSEFTPLYPKQFLSRHNYIRKMKLFLQSWTCYVIYLLLVWVLENSKKNAYLYIINPECDKKEVPPACVIKTFLFRANDFPNTASLEKSC